MKIGTYPTIAQVHSLDRVRATTQTTPTSAISRDQVSLSSDASFLGELRAATAELSDVRTDVVEQTRAELASGSFGSEADLERTIDALLMEL